MIKIAKISSLLLLALGLTQVVSSAPDPQFETLRCFFCSFDKFGSSSAPNAQPQFDRLKSLTGNWIGDNRKGKTIKLSYSVISQGSVVMERLSNPEGGNMVTMYHQDGSRLMVTHYCSVGNQPRMVAVSQPNGDELAFSFLDASNLSNKAPGYMQGIKFHFRDKSHFSQEWTFRWNDGRSEVDTFNLHRAP